jgi:hypothetical protein
VSRVATRALGAVALTVCSCTLLYDPSQYWVDGGPDAGTAEIDADTAEIDARIPSGLDADLDAFVVPADAWAADIYVPPNADADLDAGSDAFSTLDAFAPTCPAGTSLGLGSCAPVNGVAYCDPATGATRYLSEAMAGEVLPGARHELSLLGNGNLLVEAAVGDIVDFELAREGNRLVAVWLDDSTREVSRGVYTVGASGLSTPTITRAGFGGSSSVGTDLSIRPGHVDDIVVGFVDAALPGFARCGASAFGGACTEVPTATGAADVTHVLVAHADASVVGLYAGASGGSSGLFTEVVSTSRPTPTNFFDGASAVTGLRSTTGALVFSTGGVGGTDRVVHSSNASSRGIGSDLPHLAHNDATSTEYRLCRARVMDDQVIVESIHATDLGDRLDCGTDPCTIATGPDRQIASGFPELRDWSYAIVGDSYRVVTLLVGDVSGTNVTVAMWHAGGPVVPLDPITIGSGRLSPTGDGRALRTVVTRTASTLEVFVLTLVTQDVGGGVLRDRLFLSGFRLAACGA